MVSTTWLSELPSRAAAWWAADRSAWSILIVRCGRRPCALASRRCGKGGGGSYPGTRAPGWPGPRRRMRPCTACLLTPRASASERSGQPASLRAASVADSISVRPDERSSRSRAATRSGSRGGSAAIGEACSRPIAPCTYWRRPWVTTSDMVRPSPASRAFSCWRRSWSSRNVSSRLLAVIHDHPVAAAASARSPGVPLAGPVLADAVPAGSGSPSGGAAWIGSAAASSV
jgi:hypothetical protein